MTKWFLGSVAVWVMTGCVFTLAEEKKEAKVQTTKAIMQLCFDDEEGLLEAIGTMVKEKEPKWDSVAEKSKSWVKAAEDLGKNKPKKGTAESWSGLTKKWLEEAKTLDTAAGKKDVNAVSAALKTFGASCKACHTAHK